MSVHKQTAFLILEAYRQYECHKSNQVFILDGGYELHNEFYSGGETWGFSCSDQDQFFIIFRGTESIRDWLVDAECIPNELGEHSGFYELFESIYPQITNTFLINYKDGQDVICGGHSAGGPLATKAAADISSAHAITFASPKFATRERSMIYNGLKHDRFVNSSDEVPRLPSFDEYIHIGAPIITPPFGNGLVSSHSMDSYYEVTP